MSYLPVVIIGAGRSGTNMLRDILTRVPGVVTWPCDEINYIWRHGNLRAPTDEFEPDWVTPDIQKYVKYAFGRLDGKDVTHVVEKTCANSLRVGFVDRILPNACYVHLVRDGRDVALSASQRWTATLDMPYLLRKARFVPKSDLSYYAARYLWSRVHRLFSKEKRLSFWGPRYDGMNAAHADHSLLEVCALQWQRCVQCADAAFQWIAPSRVHHLRYEDFVADPAAHLRRLGSFLGIQGLASRVDRLVTGVSPRSVGAAQRNLSTGEWTALTNLVAETLEQHGYARQTPQRNRRAA